MRNDDGKQRKTRHWAEPGRKEREERARWNGFPPGSRHPADSYGLNSQLVVATLLAVAGVGLLFMGFWCAPEGEIHQSVLIGFGEVSTFAGALFGVDYSYKYRREKRGYGYGE